MGGITIRIESSGLTELIDQLRAAEGDLRERLEDALAEKAIEYNQDLRGAGPGAGLTPFRTGRLLTSGNIEQNGLNIEFTNTATDPDTGASYAEWAHKSGESTGGYARSSELAFERRLGDELPLVWDAIVARDLA